MTRRFVYVVGMIDNPVKIGVASNIKSRMTSLQVSCPDRLVLFHCLPTLSHSAMQIERACHLEFAEHHRSGEWFNINAAQAWDAVNRHADIIEPHNIVAEGHSEDLLARIGARNVVPSADQVRTLLVWYKTTLNSRKADAKLDLARVDGRILRECGAIGLSVFRLIFIEGRDIRGLLAREPRAVYRAYKMLAKVLRVATASWGADPGAYAKTSLTFSPETRQVKNHSPRL